LSQPSTPEGAEDSESNVSDSPSHQSDSSLPLPSTPEGANDACVTLPHTSVLSKLLAQQVPAIKYPDTKPKYSARVLTSLENRLQLEEKERRKKEEAEEKERKKKAREQKRLAVAEEKQRKALEREKVKPRVMVHPGSSMLPESDSPCSSQLVPVRGTQCECLLVQHNGAVPT